MHREFSREQAGREAGLVEVGAGGGLLPLGGGVGRGEWGRGQQGADWAELQGRLPILSPTGSLGRSGSQRGRAAGGGPRP